MKSAESKVCTSAAKEILLHLQEHEEELSVRFEGGFDEYGLDTATTLAEWRQGFTTIVELAAKIEGTCRWVAYIFEQDRTTAIHMLQRFDALLSENEKT